MREVFKYILTLLYIARVLPYTHHPFGGRSYVKQKLYFIPSRETVKFVTPINEESGFNAAFDFDTLMSDLNMEDFGLNFQPQMQKTPRGSFPHRSQLFVPAHNVYPAYSEKQFREYLKSRDKEYAQEML